MLDYTLLVAADIPQEGALFVNRESYSVCFLYMHSVQVLNLRYLHFTAYGTIIQYDTCTATNKKLRFIVQITSRTDVLHKSYNHTLKQNE